MNKTYRKLALLLAGCLGLALLILLSNHGLQLGRWGGDRVRASVTLLDQPAAAALSVTGDTRPRALILYSPGYEASVKYEKNLRIALQHLRIRADSLELSRTESVSYSDYDLVILASACWEAEMTESAARLLRYVSEGGRLLVGTVPESLGPQFALSYRSFGSADYGDYLPYDTIEFCGDVVPGITGRSFTGESLSDVMLSATLEEDAVVYAWGRDAAGRQSPLIWRYDCGQGRVAVFNCTCGSGDFWRGMAAGCVNLLFDTTLYPVINALCLFIDDFPSPQYESESDVVRAEYNRSAKEFYRDIWWPDMLQVAKAYGDIYTGLFVATYNNEVIPDKLVYAESATERYFGASLLKNGYEMGAHGYNHQPLTLAGGTPAVMQYRPWADEAAMTASLQRLGEITAELFPGVALRCYVPPSNYLSAEGRRAVAAALPDLSVISGIYTNEEEEGEVYVQDFSLAADGVVEFPRVTAGMAPDDFEQLSAYSALGLYGVFSHFIHPDDIFDLERGKGQTWEQLYRSYCAWMQQVHTDFPFLRSLSATEAADALRIAESAQPHLEIGTDAIRGSIENFCGETCFYLKTDRTPRAVDENCAIRRISGGEGEGYYLLTVKSPNFTVKLV